MEGARQTAEQRALAALELRAALRARLIDIAWRQEQGVLLARQEAVLAQLEAQALSAFEAGRGTENDVLEARLARQARVQGQLQNDTALASVGVEPSALAAGSLLPQGPPRPLKRFFRPLTPGQRAPPSREQLEAHPAVRRLEAAWKGPARSALPPRPTSVRTTPSISPTAPGTTSAPGPTPGPPECRHHPFPAPVH